MATSFTTNISGEAEEKVMEAYLPVPLDTETGEPLMNNLAWVKSQLRDAMIRDVNKKRRQKATIVAMQATQPISNGNFTVT